MTQYQCQTQFVKTNNIVSVKILENVNDYFYLFIGGSSKLQIVCVAGGGVE